MKIFDLPESILSIIIYDYLDSFYTLSQLEIALNNKKLYEKLLIIYKNSKKFSLSLTILKKNNKLYIDNLYNKNSEKEKYFFSSNNNENSYDADNILNNYKKTNDLYDNDSASTSPESTSPGNKIKESNLFITLADPLLAWIIKRNIKIRELNFQDAPINNFDNNIILIKLLLISNDQIKLYIPYNKWSLKLINNLGKRLESLEISLLNNWNNYIPLTSTSSTLYYSSSLNDSTSSTTITYGYSLKLIELFFILTNCLNLKTLTILTNNGMPVVDEGIINFVTFFKVYKDFQEFNYNRILEINENDSNSNMNQIEEKNYYLKNYFDKLKILNDKNNSLNSNNICEIILYNNLTNIFLLPNSSNNEDLPKIIFKHTSLLNLCYVSPIVPNESLSKLINYCSNIERIIGMSAFNSIKNKNFLLYVNKDAIKNLKHLIFFSYSSLSTKILNKILLQARKIESLEIEQIHYCLGKNLYQSLLISSAFNIISNSIDQFGSSNDEDEESFDDIFNNESSTFSSSSISNSLLFNSEESDEEIIESNDSSLLSSSSQSNLSPKLINKQIIDQDIFYNLMLNSSNLEILSLRNGVIMTTNNLNYFYIACKNLHTLQIGIKKELIDTKKNYLYHLFETILKNRIITFYLKNSIYLTNRILYLMSNININLTRLEFVSCHYINFYGIKHLTKLKNLKLIICEKCFHITTKKYNELIEHSLFIDEEYKLRTNLTKIDIDNEDNEELFHLENFYFLSKKEIEKLNDVLVIIEK